MFKLSCILEYDIQRRKIIFSQGFTLKNAPLDFSKGKEKKKKTRNLTANHKFGRAVVDSKSLFGKANKLSFSAHYKEGNDITCASTSFRSRNKCYTMDNVVLILESLRKFWTCPPLPIVFISLFNFPKMGRQFSSESG